MAWNCLIISSCNKNNSTEVDVLRPRVSISYPLDNSDIILGSEITIRAEAKDNVAIKEVIFYIDG